MKGIAGVNYVLTITKILKCVLVLTLPTLKKNTGN